MVVETTFCAIAFCTHSWRSGSFIRAYMRSASSLRHRKMAQILSFGHPAAYNAHTDWMRRRDAIITRRRHLDAMAREEII